MRSHRPPSHRPTVCQSVSPSLLSHSRRRKRRTRGLVKRKGKEKETVREIAFISPGRKETEILKYSGRHYSVTHKGLTCDNFITTTTSVSPSYKYSRAYSPRFSLIAGAEADPKRLEDSDINRGGFPEWRKSLSYRM